MTQYQERKSSSKSATRALDVLEYFGTVRQPLRAKHIAQTFHLHPSSVDQLLKTMVRSGYLIFDPISKVYDLSPRLTNFALWLTSECFWNSEMNTMLDDLRSRTRAMVSLAQRTDDFVRIVDCLLVEEENYPTGIGSIHPLDTVAGQAFLASCDDDDSRRMIAHAARHRHLPEGTADTVMEEVRSVRSVGHAVGNRYDRRLWSVSVALPMHPTEYNRTMVLSVSGTKERMYGLEDSIIQATRQCADEILSKRAMN